MIPATNNWILSKAIKLNWYSILLAFLAMQVVSCSKDQDRSGLTADQQYTQDTTSINAILAQIPKQGFDHPDSALAELGLAQVQAEKIGYRQGVAKALLAKGNILYGQNKIKEALTCYKQGLEIAQKDDFVQIHASCLEAIASVTLGMGDDHLAFKLYYESLPLFEQCGDKTGIAKVYNIIGFYKAEHEEFDSAEVYYRKAIRLNQETGNTTGIVHNKGNLGYMYENSGDFEKAKVLYKELVALLLKSGDRLNLAAVFYNYSSLYQRIEQNDSAIEYLRKSIAISEQTHDTSLLASLYGNLGELLMNDKKHDEAAGFLAKSVVCAKTIADFETELHAHRLLIELDTLTGHHNRALGRVSRMLALSDSMYRQKERNNVKNSELTYENEKQMLQIRSQESIIRYATRDRVLLGILLGVSLIAVILMVMVIVLQKRNLRKNKALFDSRLEVKNLELNRLDKEKQIHQLQVERIEEELTIKERALVSIALGIEQKNELLNLVSGKIRELASQEQGAIQESSLTEILSAIKAQVAESEDSDLFNQHFVQLHKDFFSRLKAVHPELTKNELRFCAYLRIHLSGNQIAGILSVTPEAIRKTRHRIRKKMDLSQEASLEDYISGF